MAGRPVNVANIIIDTSVLNKITAEIKPRASAIIEKYGEHIMFSAVKRAPVDTGDLIDTITANSKLIEPLTFRVQDGKEYGIFQELGTHKMSAHPFLRPAVEEWRERFLSAFSELFK